MVDEILNIAGKISGVSLGTILVALIVANKKRVWTWVEELDRERKDHEDREEDLKTQLKDQRAECDRRTVDYEKRLTEQKADFDRREGQLRSSIDRWQSVTLSIVGVSDELTKALKDIQR